MDAADISKEKSVASPPYPSRDDEYGIPILHLDSESEVGKFELHFNHMIIFLLYCLCSTVLMRIPCISTNILETMTRKLLMSLTPCPASDPLKSLKFAIFL
jgi:hypothetical protein